MLNFQVIPARSLQKSYKAIVEGVKRKKLPVVLTTRGEPQAAIVSLDDLDKLKQVKIQQASLNLLALADKSQSELKNLPTNLREQADEILYGKL